jgi:hypothetical protein
VTPKPPRKFAALMVFLAVSYTMGFFASLGILMFVAIPNENRELVSMMLGNLVGFVAGIVTYHFGSSQESAEKNSIIATQADAAKSAQAALSPASTSIPLGPGDSATIVATEDKNGSTDV